MPGGCTTAVDRILVVIRQVIQVLSKLPCAGAMATRNPASRVFSAVRIAARLHRPHAVLHDLLHASQRLMNLGAIGDLPGGEFVPAQPTDKIGTELQLPEPDLEQLLAHGTGQIDACAPDVLEQAAPSVSGSSLAREAWQ